MTSAEPLDAWVARQERISLEEMLRSISALDRVHARPEFAQVMRPAPGSVLASPVSGRYDPDPDYFFHWTRDAALVLDALRLAAEAGLIAWERARAIAADWIHFETRLCALDGAGLASNPEWSARAAPEARVHLRSNAELRATTGDAARADARFNPDGSIDGFRWGRPQYDGPALRVAVMLAWRPHLSEEGVRAQLDEAADADLGFVARTAGAPCVDLWEEVDGVHYFTLRVQALALEQGASWLRNRGSLARADAAARVSARLLDALDQRWDPGAACFRARDPNATGPRDPDISTALALLRAPNLAPRHGVRDARALPAIERLVAFFHDELPINRSRPAAAPALGRFPGDVYFGGGAWFIAILGAAEFFYRLALVADAEEARAGRLARADAFLETARASIPPSGWMSEQIDRETGAPLSAQRLAWSYAAFLSCAVARRAVA